MRIPSGPRSPNNELKPRPLPTTRLRPSPARPGRSLSARVHPRRRETRSRRAPRRRPGSELRVMPRRRPGSELGVMPRRRVGSELRVTPMRRPGSELRVTPRRRPGSGRLQRPGRQRGEDGPARHPLGAAPATGPAAAESHRPARARSVPARTAAVARRRGAELRAARRSLCWNGMVGDQSNNGGEC